MKTTYARRYRRNSSSAKEAKMFKKDNQSETAFFGGPPHESFFKPNVAINRKCDQCEAEDKKVNRSAAEEEKKIQKAEDKKEEVHRQPDHKEEEKKIQKMENKKEEEVHRQPDHKDEEKKIQKAEEKKEEEVHRQADHKEEEKKIDKKESSTASAGLAATGTYIQSLNGKGSILPKDAQHFFGNKMGYDFSGVKIHTDTEAEKSAKNVNAKAYAVDNHIVFNKGQYNPATADGKKLLAHELTHVIQQKENTPDILSRIPENTGAAVTLQNYSTGHTDNKRAFGCEGLTVQGHTDANYTDSFNPTVNSKPSNTCTDCDPQDCFTVSGMLVSTFRANPVITLPSVPDGLTECETKAVSRFINTTLRAHEQKHVAAFNTYNGVKRTPYKFTGCRADFDSFMQQKQADHDALNTQKTADANAKSDTLDPFSPTIPCDCQNN